MELDGQVAIITGAGRGIGRPTGLKPPQSVIVDRTAP